MRDLFRGTRQERPVYSEYRTIILYVYNIHCLLRHTHRPSCGRLPLPKVAPSSSLAGWVGGECGARFWGSGSVLCCGREEKRSPALEWGTRLTALSPQSWLCPTAPGLASQRQMGLIRSHCPGFCVTHLLQTGLHLPLRVQGKPPGVRNRIGQSRCAADSGILFPGYCRCCYSESVSYQRVTFRTEIKLVF